MRRDALSDFAADVRAGLGGPGQKWLPARWLYDDLGSSLFEAITHLPEYGLTRADERVITRLAPEIATWLPGPLRVAEFGSGSGRKTAVLLRALKPRPVYHPIDVSAAALLMCSRELAGVATVLPEEGDYLVGLARVLAQRPAGERLLLLFLGSTLGNFRPDDGLAFLRTVRSRLRAGDALLLGADLIKDARALILAYDDPTGVTAAFNRNLLGRINRELGANFELGNYRHEARYERDAQRIEMHLRARCAAHVEIPGAGLGIDLAPGETLWTESSHKFTERGLDRLAAEAGWLVACRWTDSAWPLAETLLVVP